MLGKRLKRARGTSGADPRKFSVIWPNVDVSDQISHSVVSDSLRPHKSQHARPPCPSPTPGVHGIRRGGRAQRRGCRKTSGFLSRETGISGNFVGRIKGAKCPFDLQFLTWDFS